MAYGIRTLICEQIRRRISREYCRTITDERCEEGVAMPNAGPALRSLGVMQDRDAFDMKGLRKDVDQVHLSNGQSG